MKNVLIILLILGIIGAGYYFWNKRKKEKADAEAANKAMPETPGITATVVDAGAVIVPFTRKPGISRNQGITAEVVTTTVPLTMRGN